MKTKYKMTADDPFLSMSEFMDGPTLPKGTFWKKCPSVSPGGKPFFWVRKNDDLRVTAVVVWNRAVRKWMVTTHDEVPIVYCDSAEQGKKFVEQKEGQ